MYLALLFALIAPLFVSAADVTANTKIGVLRYYQYKKGTGTNGKPTEIVPVFSKADGKWTPTDAPEKSWNVISDGKVIGQVEPKTISSFKKQPSTTEFDTFEGVLIRKPFALVSHGFAQDPEQWKPWHPSSSELNEKREKFIKLIGMDSSDERKHFRCPGFTELDEKNKAKADNCKNEDKIQLKKSYIDRKGSLIAHFLIETDKPGEFEGTTMRVNKWASFLPSQNPGQLLFSDNPELWDAILIEAADFDQTGQSKLLFEVSGYNKHGFYLYDNQFKVLAKSIQSFH